MSGGGEAATVLPRTLPIFPLTGVLLLPRGHLPLTIFEPRYRAMVRDAWAGERLIGVVQPRRPGGDRTDNRSRPEVYPIGCVGRITRMAETKDGRYMITLSGVARFSIQRELPPMNGYRRALADYGGFRADLAEDHGALDRGKLLAALHSYFSQVAIEVDWNALSALPDERLISGMAMACPFAPAEKQALLESPDLAARAHMLTMLAEMAARGAGGDAALRH